DFDHLIFGPKGVFVVNSKNHGGKVVHANAMSFHVDGFKPDYVRSARADAQKAEAILSAASGVPVTVTPVIAVLCREFRDNGATTGAVPVLEVSRLSGWLKSRTSALDSARVEQLYAIARKSSTWDPVRGR
ncbi:MAG: nuclease-related domain-containing protein, partial [Angustibacter sp.]